MNNSSRGYKPGCLLPLISATQNLSKVLRSYYGNYYQTSRAQTAVREIHSMPEVYGAPCNCRFGRSCGKWLSDVSEYMHLYALRSKARWWGFRLQLQQTCVANMSLVCGSVYMTTGITRVLAPALGKIIDTADNWLGVIRIELNVLLITYPPLSSIRPGLKRGAKTLCFSQW